MHSMLNAAGSMQRLTEELDRISLPPEDTSDHDSTSRHHKRKSRTKTKRKEKASHDNVPHWKPKWTPEITQLSYKGDLSVEDSSSELSGYEQPSTPSRMSNASSKFDSAFGSFHSQTDEDSLHSWSLSPSTVPPYDNYSEEMQRLAQHLALQDLLYDSSRASEPPHLSTYDSPSSKQKRHRHHQSASMHQKHSTRHTGAALVSPSPQSVPLSAHRKKRKHQTTNRTTERTSTESHSPSRSGVDVQYSHVRESRFPSTYSHSSSNSSLYDPHTAHSHTMPHESPVEVMYRTERGGGTPPVEEPELQSYSNDERKKQDVGGRNSDSSGSTTPTIISSEMDEAKPRKTVPFHIHPQVVVNPPPRHGAAWQQVSVQREKKESVTAPAKKPSSAHKHKLVTLRVSDDDVKERSKLSEGWTTRFYQENITPQPSPQLPRRYHQPSPQLPQRYRDTGTSTQRVTPGPNPLKRSTSILQRLKRRKHGSFRYERRPKRHLPVKRAFSDRIAYHIRKGWIDYDEDLELISHPSRPRTIGRMVDTHAGRHHIVELHKPPSGRYGIYISEGSAFRRGIFISRFAEGVAAKFYIGLLSPGDEIVEVNGQPICDKSLDYVYNMLASLDSVLLMILPVSARSDWC